MPRSYQQLTMTSAVLEAQRHYYGRAAPITSTATEERTPLDAEAIEFIQARDSFYIATVSETGWPYVQHRGGPAGFLRVLNPQTLAVDDYRGNRQLLSTGNLAGGNDRVAFFLMDYPHRTRLKIMGHARVVDAEEDPVIARELVGDERLLAKVERVFVVDVVAYDWNCPQYITPRFSEAEIARQIIAPLQARIRELEAQLAARAQ